MPMIDPSRAGYSAQSYRQLLSQLHGAEAGFPPPTPTGDTYARTQPTGGGGVTPGAETLMLGQDLSSLLGRVAGWIQAHLPSAPPAPAPTPVPQAPKPTTTPEAGGGTYTVQSGDSLSAIAQRLFGDANRWHELFELNRDQIENPDLIYPGQVLKLPGAAPAAPPPAAPPPAPKPLAPAPVPNPPASGPTYTVQPGDTLSGIAQRALGDAARWPELYAANRAAIGPNPNLIAVGTVLQLPTGSRAPAGPAPAPASPGGRWSWPVNGPITSPFGSRRDPISGAPSFHTGLDIGVSMGTPIHAPLGGRVTFAGWNGGYGNYVVIDHGNGLQTAYAHQSAIEVHVGEQVAAGQEIGRVGSTGYSTGPHLHFEVKRNGQFTDPRQMLA